MMDMYINRKKIQIFMRIMIMIDGPTVDGSLLNILQGAQKVVFYIVSTLVYTEGPVGLLKI